MSCSLCLDKGGWDDPFAQLSVVCPLCHPSESERLALERVLTLPEWATARWFDQEAKWCGPVFQVKPWLLVVHNGAFGSDVAGHFANCPACRKVSSHLAWGTSLGGRANRPEEFRQCVRFDQVAYHAGGSTFEGHARINYCSLGIEGPGPQGSGWKENVLLDFRRSVVDLLELVPSIQIITGHRFINSDRKDPGEDFDPAILEGLGREVVWKDCR